MASAKQTLSHRTWTKEKYLISTDPALIPISELNAIFASEIIYWADALPEDVVREILNNSLCFGLYDTTQKTHNTSSDGNSKTEYHKLVGFARCITDFVTFVYLTDVYVEPGSQGNGLGTWMIQCVQGVIKEMPHLRRSMLFTNDWERSVPLYERLMGMSVLECRKPEEGEKSSKFAIMQQKGPAYPTALH